MPIDEGVVVGVDRAFQNELIVGDNFENSHEVRTRDIGKEPLRLHLDDRPIRERYHFRNAPNKGLRAERPKPVILDDLGPLVRF